jgi:hypothetical protein
LPPGVWVYGSPTHDFDFRLDKSTSGQFYRKKYSLPEAYSDNASFLHWIPDSLTFQNLVLIESDPNEMSYEFIKEFLKATRQTA